MSDRLAIESPRAVQNLCNLRTSVLDIAPPAEATLLDFRDRYLSTFISKLIVINPLKSTECPRISE